MSWDIKPGQEVALLTFMEKDFLPALMKADLKVTDFWSTSVGRGPQFLFGATAEDLETIKLDGISWVIVGGESGAGARAMEEEWVLNIRDQCRVAQVPFFFKQWGGVHKSRNGRMLDGRTYDEFPARAPGVAAPSKIRLTLIGEVGALETLETIQ